MKIGGARRANPWIPPSDGSCKIIQLPPELLLEVLAFIENLPIDATVVPVDPYIEQRALGPSAYVRTATIRALSQVCVPWRRFLWPMIWDTIECAAMRDPTKNFRWKHTVASALIRRSKGVRANPAIASRVRELRVVLSEWFADSVLGSFLHLLDACPNLHTLNVFYAHEAIHIALKDTLNDRRYASIRALIIPLKAYPLVACCPNLRRLFVTQAASSQSSKYIKTIVEAAPGLEDIRFLRELEDSWLPLLAPLSSLHTVQISSKARSADYAEDAMQPQLATLRDALTGRPATIIIQHVPSKYYYETWPGDHVWTKTITLGSSVS